MHGVLQPFADYVERKVEEMVPGFDEEKLAAEEAVAIFGKKRKVEADADQTVPATAVVRATTTAPQSSSSMAGPTSVGLFMSRKYGNARGGPWATKQRDRRAQKALGIRRKLPTFRIDQPIGSSTGHLPFNVWHPDAVLFELFPNGVPLGNTDHSAICQHNSTATAGWGVDDSAFVNTSTETPRTVANAIVLPTPYDDDDLEWPFINILENHLKLMCFPGTQAAMCRLLVVQLQEPDDIQSAVTWGTMTVGKLFDVTSDNNTNPATSSVSSITQFYKTKFSNDDDAIKFKVLADKCFTLAPAASSAQVPFPLDLNYKPGNVALAIPEVTEVPDFSKATIKGPGRICFGFFFQNKTDVALLQNPAISTATTDWPSFFGAYKMKWRLTPP